MLLVSHILGACAVVAGEGLDHQVLGKKEVSDMDTNNTFLKYVSQDHND